METLGLEHLAQMIADKQQALDAAVEEKKLPKVIADLSDPRRSAVFIAGKLEWIDKRYPLRSHELLTIQDFAAAVRRWGDDLEATVFCDKRGMTLVCDDGDRLERVRMPLSQSEAFSKVSNLSGGVTFAHQSLLQLLRTDLRDVLEDDGRVFFAKARSIKFGQKSSGHSSLGTSGSSMGRSVEMELLGVEGEEVPEEFHVHVPVFMFPAPDVRERLRIDVTCDFASASFRLAVNGDEIQRAVVATLQAIRGKLMEALGDDFDADRILLGTV